MKNKNKILSQMFDVRPVTKDGDLDLEKIKKITDVLVINNISKKKKLNKIGEVFYDIKQPELIDDEIRRFKKIITEEKGECRVYQLDKKFASEKVPIMYAFEPKIGFKVTTLSFSNKRKSIDFSEDNSRYFRNVKFEDEFNPENEEKTFSSAKYSTYGKLLKSRLIFAGASCGIFLIIIGMSFFSRGMGVKNFALLNGNEAYADLTQAKEGILSKNFSQSEFKFNEAYARFDKISEEFSSLGKIFIEGSRFVPFLSKVSSGVHLAEFGKDISKIGIIAGETAKTINQLKNPFDAGNENVSLLKIFQGTSQQSKEILSRLESAEKNISKINFDDIPEGQRVKLAQIKSILPEVKRYVAAFVDNNDIFTDVLGGNGPRKYLFLFQNNQEIRATGGFIGSYGVLDIFNGRIRNFFIDGVFNPDGQLKEKVVPPFPIQKISANWSLHDSNWFPDFPVSAEKAEWFFEKTGGPTVDGVITMTPIVMQKLLEVTGPIEMPEYGITIDKDNFTEKIQYEVEVDYDKTLNQPKKILADLAPKILDKIFNSGNLSDIARVTGILTESLNEKQMLIYSRNYEIEKKLSELGWSGEILNTEKDYLSVVNTNINGFKTDGVIDEVIKHNAQIQNDGSVVDTVTITRHHNGGDTKYEWWNKVNANYMRVYVPKGSQLLEAEGQVREFDPPPLDYNALGFKRDPQVQMEEDNMKIDEASGTRVYEDAGKTVFGNWTYVSPKETTVIKYRYLLPFKVQPDNKGKIVDVYSLLAQKQSGSSGSRFSSEISFPESYKISWKFPEELPNGNNNFKLETDLKTDKFIGLAFIRSYD